MVLFLGCQRLLALSTGPVSFRLEDQDVEVLDIDCVFSCDWLLHESFLLYLGEFEAFPESLQ